jgi:hypothetical protein
MRSRYWMAISLIAIAAFARLIPHPANVTPIMAMALFSGAVFHKRVFGILIPLAAMFVSDLALGTHNQMVSVYGSIVLVSLIGLLLTDKRSAGRVAMASVASSTLFFLITNFTVWLSGEMYAKTSAGLLECYTLALPFYRNGLIGDLAFSGVLFGAWALIEARTAASSGAVSNVKGLN